MESFEIPQLPRYARQHLRVHDPIYDLAMGHVANFGAALVLALILLVLTGS